MGSFGFQILCCDPGSNLAKHAHTNGPPSLMALLDPRPEMVHPSWRNSTPALFSWLRDSVLKPT